METAGEQEQETIGKGASETRESAAQQQHSARKTPGLRSGQRAIDIELFDTGR